MPLLRQAGCEDHTDFLAPEKAGLFKREIFVPRRAFHRAAIEPLISRPASHTTDLDLFMERRVTNLRGEDFYEAKTRPFGAGGSILSQRRSIRTGHAL